MKFYYNYRPQRSRGKVIFSEACVKNSVYGGGGGEVSQHALQVSRPTPRGEIKGSGQEGVSRPRPGGLQVHTWGVFRPTPGGVSQHAQRQTPQQMAIAAGGTHPSGMHSCIWIGIYSVLVSSSRCLPRGSKANVLSIAITWNVTMSR